MERRRHQRTRKTLRISCRNEAVIFDGVTLDICPLGVFVITNHCLPLDSVVDVELQLSAESPIRCQGRITWLNRGQLEHYPAGFGLQFLNLGKDSLTRILLLCTGTTTQQWPFVPN